MFVQSVSEEVNARCHIKIFLVAFEQTNKSAFLYYFLYIFTREKVHTSSTSAISQFFS